MRGPLEGRDRIAEWLVSEFDGVVPQAAVAAEVEAAERELRGQVPAGCLAEMIHRLAEQRLRERLNCSG